MKHVVFLIISLCMIGCKTVYDFTSLSKDIYKNQKKQKCGIYPKTLLTHGDTLVKKIDFINYKNDTIYFLESYNIETAMFRRAIWTNTGKIEYASQGNNILEFGSDYFIKRLYTMIESWDTATIRQEEARMQGNMLGGSMMLGMQVVIMNENIETRCIRFNEFFNIGLDN